jgi:hypothetical protein
VLTIVDIYLTRTTHYRVDLAREELITEQVFDDAPAFYIDCEKVEGGVADQAYDVLCALVDQGEA